MYKGLPDGKVGSMQYFEGLLYMLFDNSRIIRAFNNKTGTLVKETPLPVAGIGSESQWEHMRLQRININEGGVSTSHLASVVLLQLKRQW